MTQEEFIKKAKLIHGDKYDYSKVDYINNRIKVILTCKEHGEFQQIPTNHLMGYGCQKCANKVTKTFTIDDFLLKAKEAHGDKYDYSKVEYVNSKENITIICPIHGEFQQVAREHLRGYGCPKCGGTKRLTTEEFIKRARLVHGDTYDYSKSIYSNNRTQLIIICPIHGEILLNPRSHLNGQKCPKCTNYEPHSFEHLNTETFIKKLTEIYGDIYDYSKVDYKNNKIKVCITCKKHGDFWIRPNDILSGHKCTKCNKERMFRPIIPLNELINKFNEIHDFKYDYSKVNDNNYKSLIEIGCPKHGFYIQRVENHLKGKGCTKCAIEKMQSALIVPKEDYLRRFNEISDGKFEVDMSGYTNTQCKLELKCNICNKTFKRNAYAFLSNPTCPHCNKIIFNNLRCQTTEDFINKAREVHGDKYDYSNTLYIKSSEKVEIICKEHGSFMIEANSHLQGHGCPYHNVNKSIQEKNLGYFISELIGEENIKLGDKSILNGKEIDILIPNKNIGIEYDGLFWHSSAFKTNDYHLAKTIEADKNTIRLIHIFEDEWMIKPNIVKSLIKNLLNKNKICIFDKECYIDEIDDETKDAFLSINHINGSCNSNKNLGIFKNDELLSIMCFDNNKIVRFCDVIDLKIIDSFKCLLNIFISESKYDDFLLEIDRRFGVDEEILNFGFEIVEYSSPKGFDTTNGERFELSDNETINKIFDCGKIILKYNNNGENN